jgi:hypothetical protein
MNGDNPRPEPSQSHKKVKKNVGGHEFAAGFYPGFARRIEVNGEQVYDQEADGMKPFVLPNGSDKPWSMSAVELTSGKGYTVTLYIDDPNHVVERLQVTLRTPGGVTAASEGSVAGGGGGEPDVVTIDNTPVYCPPYC